MSQDCEKDLAELMQFLQDPRVSQEIQKIAGQISQQSHRRMLWLDLARTMTIVLNIKATAADKLLLALLEIAYAIPLEHIPEKNMAEELVALYAWLIRVDAPCPTWVPLEKRSLIRPGSMGQLH